MEAANWKFITERFNRKQMDRPYYRTTDRYCTVYLLSVAHLRPLLMCTIWPKQCKTAQLQIDSQLPEPTVFCGGPIQFTELKASFMSLIERKGISAAEKLYYLKYVTGPAQCLAGTYYRSDDEAYSDAWDKLTQHYGQPFVVQRAFREKLSKWPKTQSKRAEGL